MMTTGDSDWQTVTSLVDDDFLKHYKVEEIMSGMEPINCSYAYNFDYCNTGAGEHYPFVDMGSHQGRLQGNLPDSSDRPGRWPCLKGRDPV